MFTAVAKPEVDDRDYGVLDLSNGLRAVLVSDPKADKAAAAMSVDIGSMHDPEALPGLAHFCEHMLFLGTQKYPGENDYSAYLSEHGGSSNAYTSGTRTCYYFNVAHDHLAGALDRFSQFFLAPLFNAEQTDREINAVHSEHSKNVNMDVWRINMLDKHTADPAHPYHKFSTGNRDTLVDRPAEMGIDVRLALLDFHAKYYSANIMTVAILGRASLQELAVQAQELFGGIVNSQVVVPPIPPEPFLPAHLARRLRVVPIKEERSVTLCFPLPDRESLTYESRPGDYLTRLLGHEADGSILAVLKSEGLAANLSAGYSSTVTDSFGFMTIMITLTEEGLRRVDDVVERCFQYLALLRNEGPREDQFAEGRALADMIFRFRDKSTPSNACTSLATRGRAYPLVHLLDGGNRYFSFQPELVSELVALMTPTRVRVTIVSKTFAELPDLQVEPIYGTQFLNEPLESDTLHRWEAALKTPYPLFHLPRPNPFVPDSFDLHPLPENPSPVPVLLRDDALMRLWFKQDNYFLRPKLQLKFSLSSPLAYVDPLHSNYTRLFVDLLKDSLTEVVYDAELAGMAYTFNNTIYGVDFSARGFNDKLSLLLMTVVERMTTLKIDASRFERVKDDYRRTLINFQANQPYQICNYHLQVMLSADSIFTHAERLGCLDAITATDIQAFIPRLLARAHLEIMVHGNATPAQAHAIADAVSEKLTQQGFMQPLLPSELKLIRTVVLDSSSHPILQLTSKLTSVTAAVSVFQLGPAEPILSARALLLSQILSDPFFNVLRTQEQLGYVVDGSSMVSERCTYLRFLVQSEKPPAFLDERIEAFLGTAEDIICALSAEEFSNHQRALSNTLLKAPTSLSEENRRFWDEVLDATYVFNRNELVEVAVMKTTKDEVLSLFQEFVAQKGLRRSKASIHFLPESSEKSAPKVGGAVYLTQGHNLCGYKGRLATYPRPLEVPAVLAATGAE